MTPGFDLSPQPEQETAETQINGLDALGAFLGALTYAGQRVQEAHDRTLHHLETQEDRDG